MTQQLNYTQDPLDGRAGGLADSGPSDTVTYFSEDPRAQAAGQPTPPTTGIPPGLLVVRDRVAEGQRAIGQLPLGVSADPDGIITSTASPTGDTTFDGVLLDGVLAASGQVPLLVPAAVTLTLDSNTDWDATNAILTGVDSAGTTITETIVIPDVGNVVKTTTALFVEVISLFIPAQTGVGGLFELGFAVSSAIDKAQVIGVSRLDNTAAGPTTTLPANQVGGAVRAGRIYVAPETVITEGQQAFVRIIAPSAEQIGAWRSDSDSGNAVAVLGARFYHANSAILAILEVDFSG